MQHYYNSQGVWSTYQVLGIVVSKGFKSIISFSFRMVLDHLIQRQHVYLLGEGVSGVGLPTLPASVTGCLQQGLRSAATLSSGLHQVLEVCSPQQA